MVCSRSFLRKDTVSSIFHAPDSPIAGCPAPHPPLSVSQCLRYERYRGLDNATKSQRARPVQTYASKVGSSVRRPACHTPPLNYPELRSPSTCALAAQRHECRSLSRPSIRPGARRTSSSQLLRDTSDGVGSLDGLMLVEESENKPSKPPRQIQDIINKSSQKPTQSRIQSKLSAQDAEAREQAARKQLLERRQLLEKQRLDARYKAAVHDPIRRWEGALTGLRQELPALQELLLEARCDAKFRYIEQDLAQISQTLLEVYIGIVRWKNQMLTIYAAGERVQLLQEEKLTTTDRTRILLRKVANTAHSIGDALQSPGMEMMLLRAFGCLPEDATVSADGDGRSLWSRRHLWSLYHRGQISFNVYRILSNIYCLHGEFHVASMEITGEAHFLRHFQLSRAIQESFPRYGGSDIPHSAPLSVIAEYLSSEADEYRSLARIVLDYSNFGAWQHGALGTDAGRSIWSHKSAIMQENATDIRKLCRELFHIDADLTLRPAQQIAGHPVQQLVSSTKPIMDYVEKSATFVREISDALNLPKLLDNFSKSNFADLREPRTDNVVDADAVSHDHLGSISDGSPAFESSPQRSPNEDLRSGYTRTSDSSSDTATYAILMTSHHNNRLDSLRPLRENLNQDVRELRSHSQTWRFWNILKQIYTEVIPHTPFPTTRPAPDTRKLCNIPRAPILSIAHSIPRLVDLAKSSFWFYAQSRSIEVDYVCTELSACIALRSLARSKNLVIDVAPTVHSFEHTGNKLSTNSFTHDPSLAVLVLANDEKVVIVDLQGTMSCMRPTRVFNEELRNVFEDTNINKFGVNTISTNLFLSHRYNLSISNYRNLDSAERFLTFDGYSPDPNFVILSALGKDLFQWDLQPLAPQEYFIKYSTGLSAIKRKPEFYRHFALRAYAALSVLRQHNIFSSNRTSTHAEMALDPNPSEMSTVNEQNPSMVLAPGLGPLNIDQRYNAGRYAARTFNRRRYMDHLSRLMVEEAKVERPLGQSQARRSGMVKRLRGLQAYFLLTTFNESIEDTRHILNMEDPYAAAVAAAHEFKRQFNPGYYAKLKVEAEKLSLRATKPTIDVQRSGAGAATEKVERMLPRLGKEAEILLQQYPKLSLKIAERDRQIGRSTLSTWLVFANECENMAKDKYSYTSLAITKVVAGITLSLVQLVADVMSAFNYLQANDAPISMAHSACLKQLLNYYRSQQSNRGQTRKHEATIGVLQLDGSFQNMTYFQSHKLLNALNTAMNTLAANSVDLARVQESANTLLQKHLMLSSQLQERDQRLGRSTLRTCLLHVTFREAFDNWWELKDTAVYTDLLTKDVVSDLVSGVCFLKANGAPINEYLLAELNQLNIRIRRAKAKGRVVKDVLQEHGACLDLAPAEICKQIVDLLPTLQAAEDSEVAKVGDFSDESPSAEAWWDSLSPSSTSDAPSPPQPAQVASRHTLEDAEPALHQDDQFGILKLNPRRVDSKSIRVVTGMQKRTQQRRKGAAVKKDSLKSSATTAIKGTSRARSGVAELASVPPLVKSSKTVAKAKDAMESSPTTLSSTMSKVSSRHSRGRSEQKPAAAAEAVTNKELKGSDPEAPISYSGHRTVYLEHNGVIEDSDRKKRHQGASRPVDLGAKAFEGGSEGAKGWSDAGKTT